MSNPTILPDGSAFVVASYPLPKDHWLYAERTYQEGSDEPDELLKPILNHSEHAEIIKVAVQYAIRGATMCGKENDFDPDALVQNAVYALCGPYGKVLDLEPLEISTRNPLGYIAICRTKRNSNVVPNGYIIHKSRIVNSKRDADLIIDQWLTQGFTKEVFEYESVPVYLD